MGTAAGGDWWTLAAGPFHRPLYLYAQLLEVERIEGLVEEYRDHRQAVRVNWATANPDALKDERVHLDALLDTEPGESVPLVDDRAERRAAAEALLASLPSLEDRPWRSN